MADTKYEWDGTKYVPFRNTPGAYVIEWDGMDWVASKTPEGPGAFTRGLATGWEQTKGLLSEALPAMAQSALGYDEAARKNLQAYKERLDKLDKAGLQAKMTYEDVNSLGTLYDYGAEAFGQALPSMAAALIPGIGLGAAGSRFAAGRAAAGMVASRAAALEQAAQASGQVLSKEAAHAAAMAQVSQQLGTAAGAMVGSGLQNIPESFANIYDETQQLRPGVAFAVGTLKSALDSIAPVMLLRKTQGVEMGDRLTNLISSKLLKGRPGWSGALGGLLETAATEGLTEGAQELLDQAAVNVLADKSFDWKQVVDAALKGGIGAAPVGAAAGAYGARRTAQAEEQQQREAEEQKAQQEGILQQQRAAETKKMESQRAQYLSAVQLPEAYALAKEYDPDKLLGPEAKLEDKLKRKLAMRQNLTPQEEGALVNMSSQEFERYLKLTLEEDPEVIKDIPEIATYDYMNETPPPVAKGAAPTAVDTIYDTVRENIPTTKQGTRDPNQVFTPKFLEELGLTTTPEQNKEVLARLVAEGEVVQKGAFFRFTSDSEKQAFDVRRNPKLMDALRAESPETKLQKTWLEKAIGEQVDPASVPKLFNMLAQEGIVNKHGPFWKLAAPLSIDRKMRQRLFAMGYTPEEIQGMDPGEANNLIINNTWRGNIPAAPAQPTAPAPAPAPEAPVQAVAPAPVAPVDTPEIQALFDLGKQRGYVTYDDIAKTNPPGYLSLIERLEAEGIRVEPYAPAAPEAPAQVAPEAPAEPRSGVAKDPVTQEIKDDVDLNEKIYGQRIYSLEDVDALADRGQRVAIREYFAKQGIKGELTELKPIKVVPPDIAKIIDDNSKVFDRKVVGKDQILEAFPLFNLDKYSARFRQLKGLLAKNDTVVLDSLPGKRPTITSDTWAGWNGDLPVGQESVLPGNKLRNDAALYVYRKNLTFDTNVKNMLAFLSKETRRTGKEHAFALDVNGGLIDVVTDGKTYSVYSGDKIASQLKDPDNNTIYVHSHPDNTSFSTGDLSNFAGDWRKLQRVNAVRGFDGNTYFAFKPKELVGLKYQVPMGKLSELAYSTAIVLSPDLSDTVADGGRRFEFATRLANLMLARTGLIHYTEALDGVPSGSFSDLEDFYAKYNLNVDQMVDDFALVAQSLMGSLVKDPSDAPKLRKAFYAGKDYRVLYNRYAESLGSPGGLERILAGAEDPSAISGEAGSPEGLPGRPADEAQEEAPAAETRRVAPGSLVDFLRDQQKAEEPSLLLPEDIPEASRKLIDTMQQRFDRQMRGGEAFTKDISCG